MKNVKLYEILSELTKKSLKIITKYIDNNLFIIPESSWIKNNDDTYLMKDLERFSWSIVIHKAQDEIIKADEYKILSEFILSDQFILPQVNSLVGTCLGRSRFELFNIVSALLYQFLVVM